MEVHHHIAIDLSNVVNVSKDGLAHHVVSEAVEVNIFHQSLFRVLICCLELLPNSVFFHLEVIIVVNAVAEHVT